MDGGAPTPPEAAPEQGRKLPLRWILLLVAGVLSGWLAWSLFVPADTGAGYERTLPDLTLERLEGGELRLASLVGEPVVVNLWATWCKPCLRELPMMAGMMRREPGVRFVFADQGEQRPVVQQYLDEHPEMALSGVVLDRDHALTVEFQTHGLPVTLFFDREGNHVHSHIGELEEEQLSFYVTGLKAGTLNPL